jgi:hypothetical protein
MKDKFLFISKEHPEYRYTAQKSLDNDENVLVMWTSKSGKLCGLIYNESEVENHINDGSWVILENLNMIDIW